MLYWMYVLMYVCMCMSQLIVSGGNILGGSSEKSWNTHMPSRCLRYKSRSAQCVKPFLSILFWDNTRASTNPSNMKAVSILVGYTYTYTIHYYTTDTKWHSRLHHPEFVMSTVHRPYVSNYIQCYSLPIGYTDKILCLSNIIFVS